MVNDEEKPLEVAPREVAEVEAKVTEATVGTEVDTEVAAEEGFDEKQRREEGETEVKKSRRKVIILVSVMVGLVLLIGGFLLWFFLAKAEPETGVEDDLSAEASSEKPAEKEEKPKYYSPLTGLEVASEAETKAATYCVQVPNGTDGARPQAGLNSAGVIFEAIAEAGITRFAAIFQGTSTPVIGPMRSLRLYYLHWDVPFDCTIVHDGGSDEAVAAARGYKDFTNFGKFVWRSDRNNVLNRRWNNEFTSGNLLGEYNASRGYGDRSEVNGFTHMAPKEAQKARAEVLAVNPLDIDQETDKSTSEIKAQASVVRLRFGGMANYNPVYVYNAETNTYMRSYESGAAHTVYDCTGQSGELTPEKSCTETQLNPSVVVAMRVQQSTASDNYHQNITTLGSGEAVIFQNGGVIQGSWKKAGVGEQIRFYDAAGEEVQLVPGQAIVSAIPQYGNVSWE